MAWFKARFSDGQLVHKCSSCRVFSHAYRVTYYDRWRLPRYEVEFCDSEDATTRNLEQWLADNYRLISHVISREITTAKLDKSCC